MIWSSATQQYFEGQLVTYKVIAQEIFDTIKPVVESGMPDIMANDVSWQVIGAGDWYQPQLSYIDLLVSCYFSLIPKDNPIVFWNDRERQRVYETDLTSNYLLLKTYLLKFGGKSPVPELSHHEAHPTNINDVEKSTSVYGCIITYL